MNALLATVAKETTQNANIRDPVTIVFFIAKKKASNLQIGISQSEFAATIIRVEERIVEGWKLTLRPSTARSSGSTPIGLPDRSCCAVAIAGLGLWYSY